MTDERFKTLRHIEAVRNHLNWVIRELLDRAEQHDQSKLQSPEREMFDEWTHKLRATTYGSTEYKAMIEEMKRGPLQHHYENNRHHPEYHPDGVLGMNLIDLIEMMCDWKAAVSRHSDGDIYKSLEINRERFGLDWQLFSILMNTADLMVTASIFHHAEES
jgi:hypothetical protein